jgi:predicted metalloprotease with PDZ domain
METNFRYAWFSYYTKGEGLALILDLQIRSRTGGAKSLDDVLRLLKQRTWEAPSASYYLQGRGYTEDDVERAVSDVIGADMHPWFERYVAGTEDPPFAETLALAGLRLVASGAGADRQYRIEEVPDATDVQRRVREGWLSGGELKGGK